MLVALDGAQLSACARHERRSGSGAELGRMFSGSLVCYTGRERITHPGGAHPLSIARRRFGYHQQG
jgi:hypothetical protein